MKLKGEIHIGIPQGGNRNGEVSITIKDLGSRQRLIEIDIDPTTWTELTVGNRIGQCDIDFNENCPVGKVPETKEVKIRIPKAYKYDTKKVLKDAPMLCSTYEVDGWKADYQDLIHRRCHTTDEHGADWQLVTFTRYVAPAVGSGQEEVSSGD